MKIETDFKTVLVVGVTGMLGNQIASYLLERNDCKVRALIRPGGYTNKKAEIIKNLCNIGLETFEGDLLSPDSLFSACEDVDTIISAVQGNEDVIVEGQKNLIEAAEKTGVAKMIPSDFSVDIHKLDYADSVWLAPRKQANEAFEGRSVRPISVLNGAFMEVAINPMLGIVNWEDNIFTYWGDDQTLCDFTSINDSAKFTAAVAVDDSFSGRSLRVAGDVLSMRKLHELYEEFAGRKLEYRCGGTISDLKEKIAIIRKKDPSNIPAYGLYQSLYVMMSGKGKLDPLDNARYSDFEPLTFREFLRSNPMTTGGLGGVDNKTMVKSYS